MGGREEGGERCIYRGVCTYGVLQLLCGRALSGKALAFLLDDGHCCCLVVWLCMCMCVWVSSDLLLSL